MEGFETTVITYDSEEEMVCEGCREKLDKDNAYHMRFGACNQECYMHSVGMTWSDFV